MKEFNLKDLFVRQKKLVGQKEELSRSSSRVITSKLLHLPVLILFSMYNVYRKVVFRDVLGKRSNGNFEDIQSNCELLHLNYSLVTGGMVKNIAALNSMHYVARDKDLKLRKWGF